MGLIAWINRLHDKQLEMYFQDNKRLRAELSDAREEIERLKERLRCAHTNR